MCTRGLQSQCERTQVREYGSGASLFGYTKLYGQVPGGQAELLRVPLADYNTIPVGPELPDERYLFLSDILPTAWQGVHYAHVPDGARSSWSGWDRSGSSPRVSAVTSATTCSVSTRSQSDEPWRNGTASAPSTRSVPSTRCSTPRAVAGRTASSTRSEWKRTVTPWSVPRITRSGASRSSGETPHADRRIGSHRGADECLRYGATRGHGVDQRGVCGEADPLPMKSLFDKQITVRMGQCNVKRWTDLLLPLAEDPSDPLGTADLVTHR